MCLIACSHHSGAPSVARLTSRRRLRQMRVDKCAEERRRQLVAELTGLVRGKVPQLVRAHDRARVCESLFQFGDGETRALLFEEVRYQLAELSRDKYARHFVLKMLSLGSKEQKEAVGASFTGRVTALMGHKVSLRPAVDGSVRLGCSLSLARGPL